MHKISFTFYVKNSAVETCFKNFEIASVCLFVRGEQKLGIIGQSASEIMENQGVSLEFQKFLLFWRNSINYFTNSKKKS